MPNNNPTGRNQYSDGKSRGGGAKQASGGERPSGSRSASGSSRSGDKDNNQRGNWRSSGNR